MNDRFRRRPTGRTAVLTVVYGLTAALLPSASLHAQTQPARGVSPRRPIQQPLNGPNVTTERDLAAGALVDSLFGPVAPLDPLPQAQARALGVPTSQASKRTQWSARLVRNPKTDDGNPPYALIDRYGGVQRYVEPEPQIDLNRHLGKIVAVRRDTGHTLLASQLDLPRTAVRANGASAANETNIRLAAHDEPLPPIEPTPADEEGSVVGSPAETPGEITAGETIVGEPPMFDEHGQPIASEDGPYMMSDGVDPLYLDGGSEFSGGCTTCGSAICAGCGGCGLGSRPIFYARGEYLLWRFDGMYIPRLVVRGVADPTGGGQFTDATVVLGNQDILDDTRDGARVKLGYWLDDYGRWAIEGDYFGFDRQTFHFQDGGDGSEPIVGRPIIDARTGYDAVEDVSFPGIMGTVDVDASSEFQSAGIRFRRSLCCVDGCATNCGDCVTCGSGVGPIGCGSGVFPGLGGFFSRGTRHVDVMYGVRWAQLNETLGITEDLQVIPLTADQVTAGFVPQPQALGTTFDVQDRFSTSNEFVGGELGFLWDWEYRRWSLELLSKLAIGSTKQKVNISGSTRQTTLAPGPTDETRSGGLLALDSNIGRYERDELSVIPEIGFTVGFALTERLRVTGGYTFLYWSRVVRPGDQIDLEVNPDNLPFSNVPPSLPNRPEFVFRDTDLWAHGMNVGLDYRW
jgi:hypothetical protein